MRARIKRQVDIQSIVDGIECEVKSYTKAIKAVMELHEVAYRDAKAILQRRLTERLIFKTN